MNPEPPAKQRDKDLGRGITAIAIRGYKSLAEECSIEIRPLTVLAGTNSSGKSSAMQPLLLLKQTLEASYDPGALLLKGPNVRLTSSEQLLSKLPRKGRTDILTIRLEINGIQSLTSIFKKREAIELVEMAYHGQEESITLRPEMSHEELLSVIPKGLAGFPEELSRRYKEPLNGESIVCGASLLLECKRSKK